MTDSPAAPAAGRGCDLAILISYSGDGGVERMTNILIAGFLARGLRVDVLILRREGGHFGGLPEGARIVDLGVTHAYASVRPVARYLRRERPSVLLGVKDRAGRAAIRARQRAGVDTRVFVRIGNTLSQSLKGRGWLRRALRMRPIRALYPRADGIIAISRGVAEDVVATSGVDPERVHVASNPVLTPEIAQQAREQPEHRWCRERDVPLVIGVGRLTRQKDFPTLLRALCILREQRAARLLILGEGEERAALTRLIRELGIEGAVDLPGFAANPYAIMAHADVFALSSAWEGFGNVLVEAMAVGLPVVSTDCRSGPREILDDGAFGSLVPVGDARALARALAEALDHRPPPDRQKAAAAAYTPQRSIERYLAIIGLDEHTDGSC
jgi:glycosyltransferase involved in cell wall biosynthesis